MHNLKTRLIIVLAVILLAGYAMYPPSSNLRLGKDLSGGVTLVYAVQIGQNEAAGSVMDSLIQVLKKRVDPDGLMNITMVPQGRDRLEITMPLPTEEVKALKRAFEEELAKLGEAVLTEDELNMLVAAEPQDRTARIDQIAGSNAERKADLEAVAAAYDASTVLRARYDEANRRLGTVNQQLIDAIERNEDQLVLDGIRGQLASIQTEFDSLIADVSTADIKYDDLRDAVLAKVIDAGTLEQALHKSNADVMKRDLTTGEQVVLGNARQEALAAIREGQPPETLAQIDAIVAAWDAYEAKRRALDDPEDLKRLLRGAGVLDFRITVDPGAHAEEERLRRDLQELGPRNSQAIDAAWFKINKPTTWIDSVQDAEIMKESTRAYFEDTSRYGLVAEQYGGEYYVLCYTSRGNQLTKAEGNWKVASAMRGVDRMGRPAIDFIMDTLGSHKLGDLTGNHVGDHMAVLLDDQVYTAPTLQGQISTRGQISGQFEASELEYIIQTLNAGSLQAKLAPEPISQNLVGPSLGLDQLRHGLNAGVVAIIAVAVFMVIYYFDLCGGIAVLSLLCNALLILGVMAANRAAFTLPGIAGVILTFGMAVDANVLIYERIREELHKGSDARAATRIGYQKALSSIVDGNVTNLIVCLVLYYTGTQEIRGFAITLGIGVLATLFSVLVIGRLVFDVFVEGLRFKRISMLPMVVPVIERTLTPNVNWIGLRWLFLVISAGVIGFGGFLVSQRGEDMLGIEFRGGTMIALEFSQEDPSDQNSPRVTMTRPEVVERLRQISAIEGNEVLGLAQALVVPLNPLQDGITSDTFEIRTLFTEDPELLQNAVSNGFRDMLDTTQQVIEFTGIEEADPRQAPLYPLVSGQLEDNLPGKDVARIDVTDYVGGVAIHLENINPPITLSQLETRMARMREQPDFSRTLGRQREVRVIATDSADSTMVTEAIVIVVDDGVNYFDNEGVWWVDVAGLEWRVVTNALGQKPPLASLQNFSPAIAQSFKARAIVSVLVSFLLISIYIWVRFGSVRYSLAALACLVHDVIVVIGLVAVVEFLWDANATRPVLQQLKLLPFHIDLNMVAALLTIIGYSLNDTIIIMDRIRENKGKLSYASKEAVNSAVNSTISRTVITSGTTLLAVIILYTNGGEGVRSFSFALLCGVLVGTYSSVAVAAPLVWSQRKDRSRRQLEEAEESSTESTQ